MSDVPNRTRETIVIALSGVELTAAELVAETGVSLCDVKNQLKVLIERGIVERCGPTHEPPRFRYASKRQSSSGPRAHGGDMIRVRSRIGVMN